MDIRATDIDSGEILYEESFDPSEGFAFDITINLVNNGVYKPLLSPYDYQKIMHKMVEKMLS